MKVNHAYMMIGGRKFMDYTVFLEFPSYYRYHEYEETGSLITAELSDTLDKNIDSLLDKTFVPKKGDEIFVAPKCKHAIQDIRRNYKLKKAIDTGTCNVYSSICLGSWRATYGFAVVCQQEKTMCLLQKNDSFPFQKFRYITGLTVNDIDLEVVNPTDTWITAFFANLPKSYRAMLAGKTTKPCVSDSVLDLNSGTDVTLDLLKLVYFSGSQEYSKESEKKHLLQLNILNNHNWRMYPGTISLVHNLLIHDKHTYHAVHATMNGSMGGYPKQIREILLHARQNGITFKDDNDKALAIAFVDDLLDVGMGKFTTVKRLLEKLSNIGLTIDVFDMLYSNVVRIAPR